MTRQPTRRQVLCGLAAALAAPGVLAACSSAPAGPASTPLADIPVGGGRVVRGSTGAVLLVQPTAGTVRGFDARCPHQGTAVDAPVDGVVVCPNHDSRFDAATGAVEKGPATRGLTEVPVSVVGDAVQVT